MSAFSRRQPPHPEVNSADVPVLSLAQSVPTLGRRLLAWSLEVTIVAASVAGPLYLGGKLNQTTEAPTADLTPTLTVAQTTIAKSLGLSPRSLPEKVTPLTNVLWSASLGLPLVLAIAHVYSMGRYGRSWPKQWLGVQVLALNGKMPGWRRALMREGLGKWGGPLVAAYGVWQFSGAFPGVVILGGLGLLALVGESLTGLGNRPRRPWHDWLAGTCVVDQETGAIIRLSSLWNEEADPLPVRNPREALAWADTQGGLTSVVLNPMGPDWGHTRMRPSGIGLGLGLLLVLGGLAGIGSYHLVGPISQVDDPEEALYVNLVSTLTNPEIDAAAQRAAVLALGNLPDDRVAPLLVDLIAQTEDPQWLDALQQALVSRGFEAVPYLRRLNQSLKVDFAMQSDPALRQPLIIRLQTVNRILAKLVVLNHGDRPYPLNLSDLHLGHLVGGNGDFTLVLRKQDLSGTQWQGTVLNRAQLQGAQFYNPGEDNHPDTYDDRTADLSGADLTDTDLTSANLSLSRLVSVSLLRATLNNADLTLANLTRANLEQARLIQADLSQAQLVEARLSKADLTEAQLQDANLEAARLSGINAAGAKLSGAMLRGASAQSSNLADANLTNATLENADFTGARLPGANLRGANLSNAILKDADLRDVWLEGADLQGADLAGAILTAPEGPSERDFVAEVPDLSRGNQLAGVDFSKARNLGPEQLAFICVQGGIHPACDLSVQE
ncbi:MAG: pentapeptide repeat-containing protein [Leptolyngbya sp. SIO1E4]|nr:pentapeptide repeat-containing protein [Leptolyngbya sp. SIO1E4]